MRDHRAALKSSAWKRLTLKQLALTLAAAPALLAGEALASMSGPYMPEMQVFDSSPGNAGRDRAADAVTDAVAEAKSGASGVAATIGTPRAARYDTLIAKHARANGVPVALAHAVVRIESNYNARARGRAGEVGLMQIKPASARGIGYGGGAAGLYDPDTNLRWGMKYLGMAHQKAGGDLCGTIMRYNGGLYAKRMSAVSSSYCRRVQAML